MTPAERASMDAPRILNRYRLIERLASGGSAEVWRAHDERLNRPVAIKRLHAHLLPDVASRRRLAAEARAAAALSHPAVVGVYDVDIGGESPVLVMELVEGESLADRLAREGRLEPADAARIGAELGDALFHAHQQGVIHRDVKPGNVLIGRDGRVRLVDFGIAHSLAASAERLTRTGTVVGTLRSMAPEQLAAGPITPRTDLYGLGAVLHEMLTGRPPYPSATALTLAEAQRRGPPQLERVDPALAAVTAACLAYDPADRPLHAGAVAAALRDWIDGDPRAAAAMAPAAAPVASADDETVTSHAVVPPVRVSPARP
ncbi:MAG: serine/threonine protein kinase, partial [Chloroflexi bacterium]|nr:serine/threonine protein kinase [Chloroflexota bacterium]